MKKTLVLGASLKKDRYSNLAINRLVDSNHIVVAIGREKGQVAGVSIETELMDFIAIDTVTIYLYSLNQKEYYDYVIGLNPRRVIFNPGSENPEFYKMLTIANINIEVACTLVLLSTNQY